VRRYVRRLQERLSACRSMEERLKMLNLKTIDFNTPSSKRVMWWLISKADDLEETERLFVEQLRQLYPATIKVEELAHSFQEIVKQRESAKLDEWLEAVEQSAIVEFKGFADGLRREKDSVMAALKYPWSTSPVEGHINKLKMIKRQMFGRAKLDLLKARVINY
jgi:transposase